MNITRYFKYIKPIRNRRDHRIALKVIERFFDAKANTPAGDLIEVLTLLVEKYERKRFSIEPPDIIEAIKFRMEQLSWTNKDLERVIGGRNRVSEILNGRRRLSSSMKQRLFTKMGIPAEILITA